MLFYSRPPILSIASSICKLEHFVVICVQRITSMMQISVRSIRLYRADKMPSLNLIKTSAVKKDFYQVGKCCVPKAHRVSLVWEVYTLHIARHFFMNRTVRNLHHHFNWPCLIANFCQLWNESVDVSFVTTSTCWRGYTVYNPLFNKEALNAKQCNNIVWSNKATARFTVHTCDFGVEHNSVLWCDLLIIAWGLTLPFWRIYQLAKCEWFSNFSASATFNKTKCEKNWV